MEHSSTQSAAATLLELVRLARPRHWIKNVFVLAPIPFAVRAGAQLDALDVLLGLVGFSLVNSAIYTLNDLFDAKADRLHPEKQLRPIAAGRVAPAMAGVQVVLLAALGVALCAATRKPLAITTVLTYVGLNMVYTAVGKHVPLLDVFLLASGFVLRVLLGCALVSAVPSSWLLLCTSALSLFLGFLKRKADLVAGVDVESRPSLRGYTREFLDQAISICAGVALLGYALYSIESNVFVPGREMVSMPMVAFGILNYLRLASTQGAGGSPVEIAFSSRSSQLCALGWIIAVIWSLGLKPW